VPHTVVAEIVGNVGEVLVAVGDQVGAEDPVVLLESMKMEIPVLAEVPAPSSPWRSRPVTSSRRATPSPR
jgi:Pyruvate carboxylase